MLIHPWDAADEDASLDFVRSNEFGHLIAAGRGRDVPVVVPTQFHLTEDRRALLHLARPNPIWTAIDENPMVLLSVAGDWAYIPGAWKILPGEGDPAMGVPTTYYAAVQLVCRARVVTDAEGKAAILRRQIERLDHDLVDPVRHERRFPGIRGLELTIEKIDGKFKYGGNADAAHREHISRLLRERNAPGDAAARERLARGLHQADPL
ncbi:FMN-binding negative transcriptional regulator [Microtetraspora glauca]|uniref:FMN-binding negative transcriptional regulator n=1 Tax=Microtetraspora glauca TaxID=1996 RepID=A0ABV3G9T0_MICGL